MRSHLIVHFLLIQIISRCSGEVAEGCKINKTVGRPCSADTYELMSDRQQMRAFSLSPACCGFGGAESASGGSDKAERRAHLLEAGKKRSSVTAAFLWRMASEKERLWSIADIGLKFPRSCMSEPRLPAAKKRPVAQERRIPRISPPQV